MFYLSITKNSKFYSEKEWIFSPFIKSNFLNIIFTAAS